MSGDKLTVTEALRKHLVGLLFDVDPMCGHADCEYTANLIAPSIVDFMTRTNTTTELVEALRDLLAGLDRAYPREPYEEEPEMFARAREALALHDRALGK